MNHVTETKKLNNKGFSLVELIIVIAIMAVLIGVLAPQYLKYVEKSRKAADLDNFQTVISAVQVYYTDPTHTLPAPGNYDLKFSDGKCTGTVDANIVAACKDSGVDVENITMKSTDGKGATLRFTVSTGGSEFTISNENLAKELAINKFS